MGKQRKISVFETRDELSVAAAAHVARLAERAAAEHGRFTVALSGGSLLEIVCPPLAAEPLRSEVSWSAWHVFWADERCVPLNSPESNYAAADRLLFRHVAIPRHQIHAMDDALRPPEAAEAYEAALAKVLQPGAGQLPRFDLVLLGIGQDGHTASLFQRHPLLKERRRWAASLFDAPKSPPERITLTLPVLNNARHVIFVAAGADKAPVVSEVLGKHAARPSLPAQMVIPSSGDLLWLLDRTASAALNEMPALEEESCS